MTKEEMQTQLDALKSGLETAVTEKAKAEITLQIKGVEDKIKAFDTLKTEFEAMKAANVVRDEADKKNQEALDKLIAEKKDIKIGKPETKSFDNVLKDALEAKTDDIAKFERRESKSLSIEIKAVGDVSVSNVTGSLWSSVSRPGIITNPNVETHVRVLLPGGSIGAGTTYTFMKENGVGEGSITAVSEGALKPQVDIDLIEASVNIETIAGWLRVTRKAMNNIPGFISFLQMRLPELLLNVEDAEVLYGSGVTPHLKGILTSGNYVDSAATAGVLIERIIDDISLLRATYKRKATGIVMRPEDYYSFFKNKALGSGEYDLPQGVTFIDGTIRILGIPVAQTTALTAGDYVVGDFQSGAQLLTQEGMRIEFFEQDGDNVRYNKVTVRIEETVALPVYGSDYFIKGVVPAAS